MIVFHIDERNRLIRERVLLIGKNLIETREDLEKEISKIKNENREIKKEIEKINKITKNLTIEFDKFVKKDEIILVERMLKDFQPLEFMRKKDVEDLINEKMKSVQISKEIKTRKVNKENEYAW